MTQRSSDSTSSWLTLALFAGVGTVAAAAALLVTGQQRSSAPVPSTPQPLVWLGGVSRLNIDALAFLFASENGTASLLVWALQALAANNFAAQLARSHTQIASIGAMLQSGIDKQARKRLYGLGWGPQFDKTKRITRWGSTSEGRNPLAVRWEKFEMAERLLLNRVDFAGLHGRRGEVMPAEKDWTRINSFLQYEGFGETVIRQVGPDAETDPEAVISRWGRPRMVTAVEGVRFYAPGGR